MRAALVILALAGPVAAQEPVSFDGLDNAPSVYAYPPIDDGEPFSLTLVAVDASPQVAVLRIHNAMTSWQMPDGPRPLRVGDVTIVAVITGERGEVPDTVEVIAQPGFYADPPSVSIPEGGDAEIRILEWPMG